MNINEQIEIAIAEGMPSLHELQKKSGLSVETFFTGVQNTLNYYIAETKAGIEINKNVVGFNMDAVQYVLNHYLEISRHVENILIEIRGSNPLKN